MKGEYQVNPGLTIGHEAVGTIHEIGPGVTGYAVGQRVLVGAITPCGQCEFCLGGHTSQCGGSAGGWRFGNTIDGVQAEHAAGSLRPGDLTPIPDFLKDEDVLLLSDIASTGFAAAENGEIKLGDTVAVFAQGPIGLCASLGAKLSGASEVFAVDADPHRLQTARLSGATHTFLANANPVDMILASTSGRVWTSQSKRSEHRQPSKVALCWSFDPVEFSRVCGVYSGHVRIRWKYSEPALADYRVSQFYAPEAKNG